MANKYIKMCSLLLFLREVQIKSAMIYHLTPIRMVTIKKSKYNKCWQRCKEKELPPLVVM